MFWRQDTRYIMNSQVYYVRQDDDYANFLLPELRSMEVRSSYLPKGVNSVLVEDPFLI